MYIKGLSNPKSKFILLDDLLNIGLSPLNQVVAKGAGIAARHACIEKKGDRFLLRDLRTDNGTYVNNVRIQEVYLNPGDIIRIGEEEYAISLEATKKIHIPVSLNKKWNNQLKKIPALAESDLPVLILGPSGSGKEALSQLVHKLSDRDLGPIITVNCSALTESLAESELFGHVKGSFTGANSDRKGAFEIAKNGTLILDEIGDLPIVLQPKLLRALENKEIKPVGSDKIINTNVRIVACTHQNLKDKIEKGTFRLDLFYRLNVVQILVPPLADRMEDFENLLFTFAMELKVKFSSRAVLMLKKYRWPGNIRELKNLVSRASATMPGQSVEAKHLKELVETTTVDLDVLGTVKLPKLATSNIMREIEKQIIEQRLRANRGNQRKTAEDLGIPRSTLSDRIKNYSINIDGLLGCTDQNFIWG